MKTTCGQRRGRGKPWQERENRLRELFTRIDSVGNLISQDDLNNFVHSLRMTRRSCTTSWTKGTSRVTAR